MLPAASELATWLQAARASLEQDLQESSRKAASLQLQLNDKAASLDTATTALQELRQAHAKLQVQKPSRLAALGPCVAACMSGCVTTQTSSSFTGKYEYCIEAARRHGSADMKGL